MAENVSMLRKREEEVQVHCPHCGELIEVSVVVHILWKNGEAHVHVDPSASGLKTAHVCKRGVGR